MIKKEDNLSKIITVEGIALTPEVIKTIRMWQNGDVVCDQNTIDDAISYIVSSPPPEDMEEAWDLVFRLTQIKKYLKTIKPKE